MSKDSGFGIRLPLFAADLSGAANFGEPRQSAAREGGDSGLGMPAGPWLEGTRLLVVAPNWLGDAVMAIPVIHELRRREPAPRIVVAARRQIAPIFEYVDGVDGIISLAGSGAPSNGRGGADIAAMREAGADVALLLPNSFRSAWQAWRAGVPERWGYRRDLRGRLLTKAIAPPRTSLHQAEYYLELLRRLGLATGQPRPALRVGDALREAGRELLRAAGWDTVAPLVGIAPGAAYGSAKRWPPGHVARFLDRLHGETNAVGVLFGSAHDAEGVGEIERDLRYSRRPLNVVGRTDLPQLMGAASWCEVFVSNDSGAMHIASAIGL
ncbi:MAG: lipopolysaccharide heptosyltransferase II, partial [Acidobacteria bacterium]|nr:lipopolysaccharide heptosyltransferase II [Acidobacteriota bacterium]